MVQAHFVLPQEKKKKRHMNEKNIGKRKEKDDI